MKLLFIFVWFLLCFQVSQLIRCCDVSSQCKSQVEGQAVITPNPYMEASCGQPLLTIQPIVIETVYQRYAYLKKLIEEANGQEDTKKLLQVRRRTTNQYID